MYNKFVLDNGLRVVTEYIPHVKSVTVGIWVETGSRRENKLNNGVSHFIEHMLFKGTKNRNAKEIAESIDNIGGQLNAFTSKECTCFYAKVLDNHLPIAIDVLADMLFNSKFEEKEIEKEKSVVLEEINMYEDSPEDLVHDLLSTTIFDGHPLAYPILGHTDNLKNLSREDILRYFKEHYTPKNTVIAIAGNFKANETIKLIEKFFGHWNGNKKNHPFEKPPTLYKRVIGKRKLTEQLHLCLGMEGISQGDDDLYGLLLLNNIFGGSMSSRLFQRIREDKGLVYSIYSYPSAYKDIGVFTIYVGLNPNQICNVSKLIKEEINCIKNKNFSDNEFYKAKEQLKGNYILGLESTSNRMTSLGKSELLLGKIYSPKDIIEKIDKINLDDINRIIDKVFDFSKFNIAYVGNINNQNKLKEDMNEIFFS
ncbi:M16 family metallopeptidase [Caldisalinibacter kiritimatiensis]|uniref:Peptidase, M16 family n=1 Tax=Caldisalinibacter kiritimatiensis TaxID=1304284 RepID=R1CPN5_9FIRM|nr:pitrilysin family protein [Caldisalinibacter kiritimatiensis]EOD00631.1 Peptidase, M16 family [Caldisalinibacter kiritimatiensis]